MSDNRTLKPTAKRRQEARRQGRVAASGSLVGSISWLGLAALVSIFGANTIVAARQSLASLWSVPIQMSDVESLQVVRSSLVGVAVFLVPLLCLILATAVLGRIAQVGFLWVPERVLPQVDRIQPAARFVELFSKDKFALAVRALTVFAGLGAILVVGIEYGRESIMQLMFTPDLAQAAIQFATQWGLQIGACLLIVGLLDYAFQLYRFELSLQMSPEELRTEIQAVQENPQVGAGRRKLQNSIRSGGLPSS